MTDQIATAEFIPNGMVMKRSSHYGYWCNEEKFKKIEWPNRLPKCPKRDAPTTSIFLFKSHSYLRGDTGNHQIVKHYALVKMLPDECDTDYRANYGGCTYPINDIFLSKKLSEIDLVDCGFEYKEHPNGDTQGAHCFSCNGDSLDFECPPLLDCLKERVTWPFPDGSVIMEHTTVKKLDISNLDEVRLAHFRICARYGEAIDLQMEQDVDQRKRIAREDVERMYSVMVLDIETSAESARLAHEQAKNVGLDLDTLARQKSFLDSQIERLKNGQELALLEDQRSALDKKIEFLRRQVEAPIVHK